jgi:hypothetical protein
MLKQQIVAQNRDFNIGEIVQVLVVNNRLYKAMGTIAGMSDKYYLIEFEFYTDGEGKINGFKKRMWVDKTKVGQPEYPRIDQQIRPVRFSDELIDKGEDRHPNMPRKAIKEKFDWVPKEALKKLSSSSEEDELIEYNTDHAHDALSHWDKEDLDAYARMIRKKSPPLSEKKIKEMENMEKASNSSVPFPMDLGGGGRKKKRKKTKRRRRTKKKKREVRRTKKLSNGKDDRCAPKKKGDRLPFTCYTKSSLHKLKNIWNSRHTDAKILSNDPKEIWKRLKTNLGSSCKRESCWLKHQCIKNNIDKSIIKYTFRPGRPKQWKKNPDEWLNSVDIMKFMKQYERIHKDFDFMGPSPIDYDTRLISDECVWEELCKFNLKKIINSGKTKIGIIFNLDPHFKGGSHWVSLFINIKNKCIYYFDSYGEIIPPRILKLVKTIQNQSNNIGPQYKFKENKKRHQYSNTECGMFCLHFIRSMILYDNWKELSTKKLTDKEMLRLRKVYYNP